MLEFKRTAAEDFARHERNDSAWTTIREVLGTFQHPDWTNFYHAQSLTFRHKKLGHQVKIMVDGQIIVDKKVGKLQYESQSLTFENMTVASEKTRELLVSLS